MKFLVNTETKIAQVHVGNVVPAGHEVVNVTTTIPKPPWIYVDGELRHYVPPAPVPKFIANWRCKRILEKNNLLAAVESAIDALPEPTRSDVFAAWNGGAEVARNGPALTSLLPVIGLTDDQADELFRQAELLTV